jgi:hypothetical protein
MDEETGAMEYHSARKMNRNKVTLRNLPCCEYTTLYYRL